MRMPRPLSFAIDQSARKALGKEWGLYATLLEHWREIVGDAYAQKTAPVKIVFPKGRKTGEKERPDRQAGTLTIRLPRGLAMEFTFHAEQIKARINAFFGYEAVSRLAMEETREEARTVVQRLASPPLSESQEDDLRRRVEHIEDEELRDALLNFGRSLHGEKQE